jgi:hypothetical protein
MEVLKILLVSTTTTPSGVVFLLRVVAMTLLLSYSHVVRASLPYHAILPSLPARVTALPERADVLHAAAKLGV